MNRIDMLLEKWLTGFKSSGHTVDIFVNPSKKELKDMGRHFRFIADSKLKQVYIFPTDHYHRRVWDETLKPHLSDSRRMYKDPTLFGGAFESGEVINWGWNDSLYSDEVIEEWITHPDAFDFADKYFPISKWFDENYEDMKRRVGG